MLPKSNTRRSLRPSRVAATPLKSDLSRTVDGREACGRAARVETDRLMTASRVTAQAKEKSAQAEEKPANSLRYFHEGYFQEGPLRLRAILARGILELLPRPEILNRRRALQTNIRAGILVHALAQYREQVSVRFHLPLRCHRAQRVNCLHAHPGILVIH